MKKQQTNPDTLFVLPGTVEFLPAARPDLGPPQPDAG